MNPKRPIFYGWWVVLAAAAGLFWGAPVAVFSFSFFLKPLMREFHAGRGAISFAFTLQLLMSAITAPAAGWLIDRYGARRMVLPCSTLFGLTLLSFHFFSGTLPQLYLVYAALGTFVHGVGPIPYGSVISRWFDRRRGLALGAMMLGLGGGAIVVPPLAQQWIASFGWRTAYALCGAAVLTISIPIVAVLLKERPSNAGLLPDGARSEGDQLEEQALAEGLTAREAFRTRIFWLMLASFFLAGAGVQGCLIHLAALLTDRGASLQTSALASAVMGAATLTGRVGTGYLLDRLFAPRVAAILFGGAACGMAVLWLGTAMGIAIAAAFSIGLGLGAEVDIIAYLIGRYFGLRAFGEIYSFAFGSYVLAGALGPLVMGAAFDLTGSYRVPLAVLLASTIAAALLMTRLGPYIYHAHRPRKLRHALRVQA